MEIRRKVFSLLQDENGEERYYSTNEFELSYNEETGEKMFSEKEDKKMSTGAKVAAGVGGTAAVGVGALEAGYHGAKAIAKKNSNGKISYELATAREELKKKLENREINKSQFDSAMKRLDEGSKIRRKIGKAAKVAENKLSFVGKAEDAIADATTKGAKAVEGATAKATGAVKEAAHKVGESAGNGLVWLKNEAGKLYKGTVAEAKKLGVKVEGAAKNATTKGKELAEKALAGGKKFAGSKAGKIVGLSAAGVGLAGAGAAGYKIARKRAE